MIARFFIIIWLFWSISVDTNAQFADKSFYLIDSLKLDELTHSDRILIDSTLQLYHEASHDTSKLNYLGHIVEECYDEAVWPKYNQYIFAKLQAILSVGQPESLKTKYLLALARALNNIGYLARNQGNIAKGLEYYHKSLKIREEIGDKAGMAVSLNNIGTIYKYQGDTSKGLEYFLKSLKIYEEIETKEGVAISLNNIGVIYEQQGDIPKGLEYYHKSLKIYEEIDDKNGIAYSLNNIGAVYYHQGDTAKGLEYYLRSLKIQEEKGDKKGVAISLNNIGHIYLAKGELHTAKEYAKKSMETAKELGFPENIKRAADLYSMVHRMEGNFKQALEMYELFIQMRDSIKNEETQKATIRQQTKYEFEKAQLVKEQKEKETARLEAEVNQRRDNLQYSVILIAILVLFGGVLALGFINVSERMAEGIIFFSFLILFEFLLVLADPYIDGWSGGAPGIKLLFNAGIAALIFPAHAFFESKMKGRLVMKK